MEAVWSFEKSVNFFGATWLHIPGDSDFHLVDAIS
jgi:hypothetical protein